MNCLSNNMFPSLTINDFGYRFSANAILSGKNFVIDTIGHLRSYVSNGILGKFSMPGGLTPRNFIQFIFKSMMTILLRCNPFKVSGAVVRFIPVKVVHLRVIAGVFNKGNGNKSMYEELDALTFFSKKNLFVAILGLSNYHYSAFNGSLGSPSVSTKAIKRPYSTKIRNVIHAFIPGYWNKSFKHNSPPLLGLNSTIGKKIMQGESICQ